jgi:ribonuclease HI
VDDMRISYAHKDLNHARAVLQKTLDDLSRWSNFSGFKFEETKCKVMICTRQILSRGGQTIDPSIKLTLNGTILEVVKTKKFLGLLFDYKLTWKPHIVDLKKRCNHSLNLLKVIARSKFKTSAEMMLRIYRATVLSKLEYGCQAYGTAFPSNLKLLNPIHNHGIRICLGAFTTSRAESLYVEANLASLEDRRTSINLKYLIRCLTVDKNDTISKLFDYRREEAFEKAKRLPNPLGIILKNKIKELKIRIPPVIVQKVSSTPPWIIPKINVCLDLASHSKKTLMPIEWKHKFMEHKHNSRIDVYTDGSKTKFGTGAGIAIRTSTNTSINRFSPLKIRLNSKSSILSAELKAINVAMDVMENENNSSCTIYSDSKAALQSIQQFAPMHPFAQEIQHKVMKATTNRNNITFCWIPSHCGIPGNEKADKLAKEACSIEASAHIPIFGKDLYALIDAKLKQRWQVFWDLERTGFANKLSLVDPKIGKKEYSHFNTRLDEIKFARLRIGHTRLTDSHHFTKDEPKECDFCDVRLTVKHFLTECLLTQQLRLRIFGREYPLNELLDRRKHHLNQKVILFLKEADLYSKI